MSKLTIVEGNSNDKDNVRAIMVKGEKGDMGDLNHNDIIDNLTSTATDKVLSANQGRALKGLIENVEIKEDNLDIDYYQHRAERRLNFELYTTLSLEKNYAQACCTDGNYLYFCDFADNSSQSDLVKCNFDGTEISRVTMTTLGHPNGMCYCTKDNNLYINFTSVAIEVYTTSLAYVETVTAPVNSTSLMWYEEEEMFLLNRLGSSNYYYMDYNLLHDQSNIYSGFGSREWNLTHEMKLELSTHRLHQQDCMVGDFIYINADRHTYNKVSQIIKFANNGEHIESIVCNGLPIKETEGIVITTNYVYMIMQDGEIYRSSINDDTGKPITYTYGDYSWIRNALRKGFRISGYQYNSRTLPETVEIVQEETTYTLKHVKSAGNIRKLDFILQLDGGYRAIPLCLEALYIAGNTKEFAGSLIYDDNSSNYYSIFLRGNLSEDESGNTVISIARYKGKKIVISDGSVAISDISQFRVCGIIAEY